MLVIYGDNKKVSFQSLDSNLLKKNKQKEINKNKQKDLEYQNNKKIDKESQYNEEIEEESQQIKKDNLLFHKLLQPLFILFISAIIKISYDQCDVETNNSNNKTLNISYDIPDQIDREKRRKERQERAQQERERQERERQERERQERERQEREQKELYNKIIDLQNKYNQIPNITKLSFTNLNTLQYQKACIDNVLNNMYTLFLNYDTRKGIIRKIENFFNILKQYNNNNIIIIIDILNYLVYLYNILYKSEHNQENIKLLFSVANEVNKNYNNPQTSIKYMHSELTIENHNRNNML